MTGCESLNKESIMSFQKEMDFVDNVRQFNINQSQLSPPGLGALDQSCGRDYMQFEKQDQILKTIMGQTARNALANQDPCTIPDELRDELMRQKRKDDAFKTALCDSFRRNQTCSYGDQCRFAHGVQELRLPQHPRGRNHPKYKTVLCDKFSTTGNCKYGTRCQFIHKLVNPTLLTQASGLMNKPSNVFNQSLMFPNSSNDISVDLNQSLPIRRSDISRAFARANQLEADNLHDLSRVFDHDFSRSFLMPDLHFQ